MPNFLKKIQGLSEERKRIILWSIVGVIALILFIWWAGNFKTRIEELNTQGSKLKFPSLQEELKNLPKFNR
jgi:hypothetical protein